MVWFVREKRCVAEMKQGRGDLSTLSKTVIGADLDWLLPGCGQSCSELTDEI